jgi:hypothetical protein
MHFRLIIAFAALGLLLATGCQTVQSRIEEKPDVFAKLDPETQAKIKQGIIGIGYTEDMVYLAVGAPDQIRESVTTTGRTLTWIYNDYIAHYDSMYMMGYYGYPYYRYRPYGYYYYPPPLYAPYYTEKEERIRVTFSDGKVTAIDQMHD